MQLTNHHHLQYFVSWSHFLPFSVVRLHNWSINWHPAPKKSKCVTWQTNTAVPNVNVANPTDDVTRVDATNTHEVESIHHDENNKSADTEVNMDEAAEKDIDPDWKPSSNDAHEEREGER